MSAMPLRIIAAAGRLRMLDHALGAGPETRPAPPPSPSPRPENRPPQSNPSTVSRVRRPDRVTILAERREIESGESNSVTSGLVIPIPKSLRV